MNRFGGWLGEETLGENWWAMNNKPAESKPAKPFGQGDPRVAAVVQEVADDLGLADAVGKDQVLRKALFHIVSVMHPAVGQGGVIISHLTEHVCRVLYEKAAAAHRQQGGTEAFDPHADHALSVAGNPIKLLRYLMAMWGGMHKNTHLQGDAAGFEKLSRSFYDRFKSGRYVSPQGPDDALPPDSSSTKKLDPQSPTPEKTDPTKTTKAPAGRGGPVVLALRGLPAKMLAGFDMVKLQQVAQGMASSMGVPLPSEEELHGVLVDAGVISP